MNNFYGWRAGIAAVVMVLASACQATTEPQPDWFDGGPMRPASAETLQLTARVLASKGDTARAGAVLASARPCVGSTAAWSAFPSMPCS